MKTALVLHFRDDAAGSRREAYEKTRSVVTSLYPFDEVIEVDSGHELYNRSASRNLGMRQAEKLGCDVVILNDADSVPEKEPLAAAIEQASTDELIHHPFNEVWMLIPKVTKLIGTVRTEALRHRALNRSGPSQGGIWIATPETWWRSGGQDERFRSYGAEDRAHLAAANTILGHSVIHPGILLCAYHHRQLDTHENWDYDDCQLLDRYNDAFGDVETMRAITEEWRG